MKNIFALALVVSIVLLYSCNDGSIIGNDLIGNEQINLNFNDDFLLSGKTISGDSVATYRVGSNNQTYMLGEIDDPVFGHYSSDIYTGFRFGSNLPIYTDATLDSVILELEYDTLGFYGDTNSIINIEVYRVIEDFMDIDTLFSNRDFEIEMTPLASKSFRPSATINVEKKLRDIEKDSIVSLSPRFRIRLDDILGEELIMDELAAKSDTIMLENYKGLYIKATVEGNNRMIGFNFNDNSQLNSGISKLSVHFSVNDEGEVKLSTYNYGIRPVTFSKFIHDYSGSEVGTAIDMITEGEDNLFVQNMAGVNSEISLPDLSSLKGNLINSAQLVLTINEEDNVDIYPTGRRFLLSKYNDEGNRILIDDILKNGVSISDALALLDGNVKTTELADATIVKTVTFNITDYIRNQIKNDGDASTLILSPVGRQESPRRTVFYGPTHSEYAMKLRIAYTEN
ncbi:MAG: DUF4270 family protein [Saprospiraceae bacterium]